MLESSSEMSSFAERYIKPADLEMKNNANGAIIMELKISPRILMETIPKLNAKTSPIPHNTKYNSPVTI